MTSTLARRKARVIEWTLVALAAGVVAFVLFTGRAKAEDYNVTIGTAGYGVSGPGGATVIAPLGSSAPHIIHVPPHDLSATEKLHEARWWLRCRPHLKTGKYGVQFYTYAKPGCEYGAVSTEDVSDELPRD